MKPARLVIAMALAVGVAAPAAVRAEPAAPKPIAPIAAPSFELLDRGDAVEIIARNIKATRTQILPVRSRLQVPIGAGPAARRLLPGDATVKLVELDHDDATRMLSVKLGFERDDVRTLARFAQAIQVGDDLHVIVPRKVPAAGVVLALPEPTLPPVLAAAVAKIDAATPTLGPRPDPAAPIAPAAPAAPAVAAPIPAPAPVAAAKSAEAPRAEPAVLGPTLPAAATTADAAPPTPRADKRADKSADKPADKPIGQVLAPEPSDPWSKLSLYAALGLAAAGGGIWMMRRKKGATAPASTIEVIAQRSLGGKARIVWLSAGQREMIVSVTSQQVRMLGQWRKTCAAEALPAAHTWAESRAEMVDKLIAKTSGAAPDKLADRPDKLAGLARRTGAFAAVDGPLDLPSERPADRSADRAGDRPLSPAVSGILRLRGLTGKMAAVSAEVATGDVEADELWAREILAATGARR